MNGCDSIVLFVKQQDGCVICGLVDEVNVGLVGYQCVGFFNGLFIYWGVVYYGYGMVMYLGGKGEIVQVECLVYVFVVFCDVFWIVFVGLGDVEVGIGIFVEFVGVGCEVVCNCIDVQ